MPFEEFRRLVGYTSGFQLRGFTSVANDRLAEFYDHYDDLYSILIRIREGHVVEPKPAPPSPEPAPATLVPLEAEDVDIALAARTVSEHVRMQWILASLGLKAVEKIWGPAADQGKLRQQYEFNEFEREFASGIDLPKSYVENIDVVWKEQFRIDAAFEIENSTAIYSGLLRFADLSILAPNTIYPMFIVAPAERRGRVRDQLMRPTFGQLNLREKVRFLPYEAVDDIDRFFRNNSSGLSVNLVKGKAEVLT